MKVFGIILGVLLFVGIVVGVVYGAISGYGFLAVKWGSLSSDWKAILIVNATIIIFCTLVASLSIQSVINKNGLKGNGKVLAYNDFIHWYSAIKSEDPEALRENRAAHRMDKSKQHHAVQMQCKVFEHV